MFNKLAKDIIPKSIYIIQATLREWGEEYECGGWCGLEI